MAGLPPDLQGFFPPETADPYGGLRGPRGNVHVKLEIVVRDAKGNITGGGVLENDITLLQSAQFFVSAQLGVASGLSFKDTATTSHVQTAQVLAGSQQISFGTGATSASWSDFAIQTAAGGTNPVSSTVSAIATQTFTGSFTVSATWSNTTGATVSIGELALYCVTTQGAAVNFTAALTHDVFVAQAVSNGGTAAATLTYTWS